MRVFSFYIDGQVFAVDVNCIQKVARKMEITKVPSSFDAISGIINLKGRVVTVFSLYNILGLKVSSESILNVVNIIIFKSSSGQDQMGLIIDKPGILINIDDETIKLPSLAAGKEESYCICGIAELDNTLYRIINIDSIINKYKNNGRAHAEKTSNKGENSYETD